MKNYFILTIMFITHLIVGMEKEQEPKITQEQAIQQLKEFLEEFIRETKQQEQDKPDFAASPTKPWRSMGEAMTDKQIDKPDFVNLFFTIPFETLVNEEALGKKKLRRASRHEKKNDDQQ